jgi:hypothetical protein
MKLKVNLAWKIVVGIPDNGVDYCQTTKHFNLKTGKTFINKLGGVSSLDFYPSTLDPTNVFYNAIESHKLNNGFVGKKIPFEGTVAGVRSPVKIKIHQFSSDLVILSISVDQIDFNGAIDNLQKIMSIESHIELLNLVKAICSIICSGGKESSPVQRKLKAYPYVELESSNSGDFVENKYAVELLTRHQNPKLEIVQSVISKNYDHQVDDNSILIDRQGILARYFSGTIENESIKRKFESTHYLFELAISLSHILENKQYLSLNTDQKNSITKLIVNPAVVFTKSVTAHKTWKLLLEEFKLSDLHSEIIGTIQENTEVSPAKDMKGWSELKKWVMGILSALVIGLVIWGANTIYQEINPFSDKPVKLLQPLDEDQIDRNTTKINFDWADVEDAKKYILFVEKYNVNNKKWFSPKNGSRYVTYTSSRSFAIIDEGYFKWKVVARNLDEEKMSESVWFFFTIEAEKVHGKKMQSTQKIRG